MIAIVAVSAGAVARPWPVTLTPGIEVDAVCAVASGVVRNRKERRSAVTVEKDLARFMGVLLTLCGCRDVPYLHSNTREGCPRFRAKRPGKLVFPERFGWLDQDAGVASLPMLKVTSVAA